MTVTFLTVAFAQLWHVFNMRDPASRLLHNEITRNPWIWSALVLCAALLLTGAYVPSFAYMLQIVAPDFKMWGIVLAMSLAPLLIGLIVKSLTTGYDAKKYRH